MTGASSQGNIPDDMQLAIPVLHQSVQLAPPQAAAMPPPAPPADDEIDLLEYWRILVRRRATVLSVLAIAVVAALLTTFLMTPIYRSTTVLQIEREAGKVVEFGSVAPEEGGGWYGNEEFYKTQYELLASRSLARRVVEKLGLEVSAMVEEEKPSFLGELKDSLKSLLLGPKEEEAKPQPPDLEGLLLSGLTVDPVRGSRLVNLHYDSPDPEQAAKIVNTLAQEYVGASLERRFDAASYAKNFLEERIRQVRAALEDSERKLIAYAKEREIINLEDKQDLLMQRIKELNIALVKAETDRIEAEAEYQQLVKAGGMGFSKVLDSPVIQGLKERKGTLQAEYEEQLKIFKPGYPKMQQLQQQIAEVDKDIDKEVAAIRSAVKATYQAKAEREAKLMASLGEVKEQILALQDRSSDYQTLKREVDTNRELYDGLLQRMKEVGVVAGIGLNNISVVDAGKVPTHRFKPSFKKNLAIAIALGLFAGVLFAFLFEALDDTVKTVKDVEDRYGLPVLGVVPEVLEEDGDIDPRSIGLATHTAARSHLAEAYRSLRTALVFSTAHGAPRVLSVTSSGPSEGKTTSATNVAINFAQTGSKVLLIDGDLRNPSLHKIFGLVNSKGLTNFLAGDAKPAEVTQASIVERLFCVTSGPLPPNPVELLASAKMVDFLSLARERFDYVILDGPPVLGLADAVVLSKLSEGTVLIAHAGVAKKAGVEGAIKRLTGSRAKLIGVVLAKVGQRTGGYGYGYGYSYKYHYTYGTAGQSQGRPEEGLA